jgi:ABC-type multidrug transport system ATPase subunit
VVTTEIESNSKSAISIRNLEIPKGVSFSVLGANGAGKTTLVRLLIGRLKPASGSALIFGQQPGPDLADSVGYMPQLNALYEALSVRENLDFFPRMLGLSDSSQRRSAVDRAMELVGFLIVPIASSPNSAAVCDNESASAQPSSTKQNSYCSTNRPPV